MSHMSSLVVEVRNKDLERVGQIPTDDLDIFIGEQKNGVGSWVIKIAADHPMATPLRTPGAGIIVTAHDGEVLMSGPTVKPEVAATTEDPAGTLTIEGVTDSHILADYLSFPDPTNLDPTTQTASHDVRTGVPETLMHAYVNANIGPGAPEGRRIGNLVMGSDGGRGGAAITKSPRFPVLGVLLGELAKGTALSFRVVQTGESLEFQTSEAQDRTATIRLDIRNSTLAGHRVALSPPGATRVLVAGQGELTDRQFYFVSTVESLAGEALWGRRIERFVDQRNTDVEAELIRAGLDVLEEEGFATVAVQVVPMEDSSMAYGHDWGLGDKVAVVVDGQELQTYVTGYVLRHNRDGFRMGAILGDPTGFDPDAKTAASNARRIDFLERNSEVAQAVGTRLVSLEANDGIQDSAISDLQTAIVPASPMTGEVRMWAGSSAPTGWAFCRGQAISRTTESALFAVIGTTYGAGNGSTTFNVPDLQGRVPVGYNSSETEFNSLGKTGGAKTHTLTTSEMPAHTHTQDSHNHTQAAHTHTQASHNHTQNSHTHTTPSHQHRVGMRGDGSVVSGNLQFAASGTTWAFHSSGDHGNITSGGADGNTANAGGGNTGSTTAANQAATATNNSTTATNNSTTATNQTTGGGNAHNNLQPYLSINYIIKL